MPRTGWFGVGLAIMLGGAVTAHAQTLQPVPSKAPAPMPASVMHGSAAPMPQISWMTLPDGTRVQVTGTLPAQYTQQETPPAEQPRFAEEQAPAEPEAPLGPTPPESLGYLQTDNMKDARLNLFGWFDFGYTTASNGKGILPVETRENRFGNEFLFNQIAVVLERTLDPENLSFGFRIEPYGGADAALLNPLGSVEKHPDPRFGFDFRQLYLSAHLPILTDGGVDVKAGRMYTVIGYESAMAPYRPFYSNDYQWFYAQDGANTGIQTNWHITPQLNWINGVTMGANTFFTERGESDVYYTQINYWLQEAKRTLLSFTLFTGDQAFISAGTWATVIEFRIQQNWNKYLTQIIQSDEGWESDVAGLGDTQFQSLYNIFVYHLNCTWDLTNRIEWFGDAEGARTGFRTAYEEITIGADYHPAKFVSLRPEIRWDYANDARIWRHGQDHYDLTAAVDCLLKF
jgi:hypothetical protein